MKSSTPSAIRLWDNLYKIKMKLSAVTTPMIANDILVPSIKIR